MKLLYMILFATFFAGCAKLEKPIQTVELPIQSLDSLDEANGVPKVVIFNQSNKALFGIDGSGRINISLDGESVGQLNIGEYLILDISLGEHTFDLLHKDVWLFGSKHEVFIEQDTEFIKIFAKITSNGLEIVTKPDTFESKYKSAY